MAQQKQDVCTAKSFSITYTKELTARAMVLMVYRLHWYLKCYMQRLCSIFKYRCIHPIMQNTICSLQQYFQSNQTGAVPYSDTSPYNKYSFFKRHVVKRKYCRQDGCDNNAKQGGVCVKHGARVKRRYCSQEGCSNLVQQGGVCKKHGARK